MTASFQKAVETAFKVFYRRGGGSLNIDSLEELKKCLNKVTKADLRLDPKVLDDKIPHEAPVTYIRVLEDKLMTVAVFVLRQGKRLPLHDHPGMCGFLKVLHGDISIKTYTPLDPDQYPVPASISERLPSHIPLFPVKYDGNHLRSENDECCVITPDSKNIHEICSENGTAAFVDILSPPYNHSCEPGYRPCSYFKEFETDPVDNSIRYLVQIRSPSDYWCDEAEYTGPEIIPPSS